MFYASQYDFRKNCSVAHALLDVITTAFDEIQNKKNTALLRMDMLDIRPTSLPRGVRWKQHCNVG